MNTSTHIKTLAAVLVPLIIGVLLIASPPTPSSAAMQERILENKIPAHIPIKIKVKKEKEESFKDLNNEKWLSEFELEVTNTGDKPIYFLYIIMDPNPQYGTNLVYPLVYGRADWAILSPRPQAMTFPLSQARPIS